MNFATLYNMKEKRNDEFATKNDSPSLTQQSDAKDADINVIMGRYVQTGQLPQMLEPGKFGDFTEALDFRGAQEIIREANLMFAEVPSHIRKRFDNDPAQFVDFVNNPENLDELRRMGLANPEPEPETILPNREKPRYDDTRGLNPDNEDDDDGNRSERQQNGRPRGHEGRPGREERQSLPGREGKPQGR